LVSRFGANSENGIPKQGPFFEQELTEKTESNQISVASVPSCSKLSLLDYLRLRAFARDFQNA
jgi:hypothetical protein